MRASEVFLMLTLITFNCCSQINGEKTKPRERAVGGVCEGCDAVFEYGRKQLNWIDTLPDFNDAGPKLEVKGTIYHRDGKTPAADVILYIYHTDQSGEYPLNGDESGWASKHGYIRGWIKTGNDGRYKFYTLKPGAYPGGGNPAHIHPVIKEPGVKAYWIDEFLFEGDPYITDEERKRLPQRGGNGILKAETKPDGMLTVKRDIVLGLNVPGYD
jgi:protocatechuate 3,4-dioxygenase beta subunit